MNFTTPQTPDQLHAWLADNLGLRFPREPLLPGNSAPFDYLTFAFFGPSGVPGTTDCVLWANRGGGKTFLGAVATMLDLVFRPGIEVRILAGSLEQARRMHAHLRRLFDPREHEPLAALVEGRITERRITLNNGSSAELLAQSQTSVRGTRVQKLRCDEVDLFHPDVWDAAQLTTRSKQCGDHLVRGSVECLSTMHIPFGVMHRLVQECHEGKRTLFRWGVIDVLERCGAPRCATAGVQPADAAPSACPLRNDCHGRAKRRTGDPGHVSVADALNQQRRVPLAVWESEMLCLRPRRTDTVLPEFDPKRHVFNHAGPACIALWCAGMDFGFRAPTAIIYAALDHDRTLWVMDERVVAGQVADEHLAALRAGLAREGVPAWPLPDFVAPDPAGEAANDQTGTSAVNLLRRAGFTARISRSTIAQGLTSLRARLAPASGDAPRLFIHERCRTLIESLERYHYDPRKPESTTPVKGRFDHAVDALRYLVQALDHPASAKASSYARMG